MGMEDLFQTGSDIMKDVAHAVDTGDYSGLSDSIRGRVADAAGKLGDEFEQGARNFREAVTEGKVSEPSQRKNSGGNAKRAGNAARKSSEEERNYFLQRKPSRGIGIGKKDAGMALGILPGIVTGVGLISLIVSAVTASIGGIVSSAIVSLIAGSLTMAFALMSRNGKKQQQLVERYYQYGELIGTGKEYFSVAELAGKTGRTKEEICSDIEQMRANGYLPYAVLDRNKTTVILTDRMYQEYARAEQSRSQREEEERIRKMQEKAAPRGEAPDWASVQKDVGQKEAQEAARAAKTAAEQARAAADSAKKGTEEASENSEEAAILAEGKYYIQEIRAINDRIPDTEVMSDKLYQLEDIMRRIFAEVKKDPSKAGDLRKLMNYYLPTTTKLLSAYADLNEQPEAGENIRNTKRQIEESMDIINTAFGKLLDDLFEEKAWDLSSDLNVMKSMMAQDGLTRDNTWNPEKTGTAKESSVQESPAEDADGEAYVLNSAGEKVKASELDTE